MGSLYGSSRPHFDVPRLVELEDAGLLSLGSLIARRYRLDEHQRRLRGSALRALPGAASITFHRRAERDDRCARGATLASSIHSALGVILAAHGAEAVDRGHADVARPGAVGDAAGGLLQGGLAVRRERARRRGPRARARARMGGKPRRR